MAFTKDVSLLVCGGTKPANGGTVQGIPTLVLFDWASGQVKQTLELGAQSDVFVWDVQVHPDGFLIAAVNGGPGMGKLCFVRPGDTAPFFTTTSMANCHSVSLHPGGRRLAVACTNGGSNGNGKILDNMGQYKGNWSPVYLLDLPVAPPA